MGHAQHTENARRHITDSLTARGVNPSAVTHDVDAGLSHPTTTKVFELLEPHSVAAKGPAATQAAGDDLLKTAICVLEGNCKHVQDVNKASGVADTPFLAKVLAALATI
jgi:hypothetical protein